MTERLKELIEKQSVAFDAFVSSWTQKAEKQGKDIDALLDRIEESEAKGLTPGKTANTVEDREHKTRFDNWLRRPKDGEAKNALSEFENRSKKNLNISSNADGGFAVPEQISRDIEKLELKLSPVRSLARVVKVATPSFTSLVNIRGASSGWVGESTSRTETDTPQLRERAPTFGEIYAYPQTTEWALDDMFFDVGAWLAEEVADQFALAEGAAVINGDGSNKPTGMLHTAPVSTDDDASPLRAAAAYQFVPSLSISSPAVAEIVPDELITLVYSVNAIYRAGASWAMNSKTAAAIRKLKDGNGNYLWQPATVAGQPESLMGYPVAIWEQMDDIGTNKLPVAFGNFRRGYLLAERTQVRITVDANITTPGRIKYFVRRREGGCVLNNNAVKFLKTTLE